MNKPAFGAVALLMTLLMTCVAHAENQRIVSVAGALTEIVFALGGESRLVGVDTTSTHPARARRLPQVGYQRNLSAEGILSLAPDRVLASDDAGPPAVLEQLRAAGVAVTVIANEPTPEGVYQKVRGVARLLARESDGERLVERIRGELEQARRRGRAARAPRVLFLLSVDRGAPLASGRGTAADAMIRLAGGRNAVTEFEGYKPLGTEALTAAAAEVIVFPDHTLKALGGEARLAEVPGLSLTPAWRNRRIVGMDGLLLLGFGPRVGVAVETLARHLHPDPATGNEHRE